MFRSMTSAPLTGYNPPQTTVRLLEDCALETVLAPFIGNACSYLTQDAEAIVQRNEVIGLLLERPDALDALLALRRKLGELADTIRGGDAEPMRVIGSLSVLRDVHGAMTEACKALARVDSSSALSRLGEDMQRAGEALFPSGFDAEFARHMAERAVSVRYRLFFDDEAQLSSIALVGVHASPFRKTLLGQGTQPRWVGGILPLKGGDGRLAPGYSYDPSKAPNASQQYRKILNGLLAEHTASGKRQAAAMGAAILRAFAPILPQLDFFLGAAALIRTWPQGRYCFAEIRPQEEDAFHAEHFAHPLYLDHLTENSLTLNHNEAIALVGGVNRGGKTTFLRAAAAVQILFQMGLPVPAKEARLSPASAIVCAFAREESTALGYGKLGQELSQLRDALAILGGHGFLAVNEAITATSPIESCLLSREALCIAKTLCARGVWVTHLHPLYQAMEHVNAALSGGGVFPMRTAARPEGLPEFSIVPGIPDGGSGARALFESLDDVR